MAFLPIEDAMKKGKGTVALRGWVYRERKGKDIVFLVLRDVTETIQCVIKQEEVSEKVWDDAQTLLIEASVELSGTIKEDKRAPTGYEVRVTDLTVVGPAEKFPITQHQSIFVLHEFWGCAVY